MVFAGRLSLLRDIIQAWGSIMLLLYSLASPRCVLQRRSGARHAPCFSTAPKSCWPLPHLPTSTPSSERLWGLGIVSPVGLELGFGSA